MGASATGFSEGFATFTGLGLASTLASAFASTAAAAVGKSPVRITISPEPLLILFMSALLISSSADAAAGAVGAAGAAAFGLAAAGASCASLATARPANIIPINTASDTRERELRFIFFIVLLTAYIGMLFILPYKSRLKR